MNARAKREKYNWQLLGWPHFEYDLKPYQTEIYTYAETAGRLAGHFIHLAPELQEQTTLELMVAEALQTSAIEGEYLERSDVMSSIRNHLKLNASPQVVKDVRAQGLGQLMTDARRSFSDPLTEQKLFQWHKMLFSSTENKLMNRGDWRTHAEPMQVISGWHGKVKVHFEAPASKDVPHEMKAFIAWFNRTAPGQPEAISPGPVKAAIAHLYFESIHPFEDGNGRLGRALVEKALSQDLRRPVLLSLSQRLEEKKKQYYEALKEAQRSNEITKWIGYFLRTLLDAQEASEELILFILKKAKFFDRYRTVMNERQQKVIRRMLNEGPKEFLGGINAKKFMRITRCSKATATRDLADLVEKGILQARPAGGRSTGYDVHLSRGA